jgi:hypothetical protein
MTTITKSITAAAVLAVSLIQPAHAITGTNLVNWCEQYESGTNKQYGDGSACASYISGVVHTIISVQILVESLELVCFPKTSVLDQYVMTAKKYLSEHPEDHHYNAASLLLVAYRQAFPCKGQ